VLKDEVTGLMVPPADSVALAEAIGDSLDHSHTRQRASYSGPNNGRAGIQQEHDDKALGSGLYARAKADTGRPTTLKRSYGAPTTPCHSERSEESRPSRTLFGLARNRNGILKSEILRCAQNDKA